MFQNYFSNTVSTKKIKYNEAYKELRQQEQEQAQITDGDLQILHMVEIPDTDCKATMVTMFREIRAQLKFSKKF